MKELVPFRMGMSVSSDAIDSKEDLYMGPIVRSKNPMDKDQVRLTVLVYMADTRNIEQVGLAHIDIDSTVPEASEAIMAEMLSTIEGGVEVRHEPEPAPPAPPPPPGWGYAHLTARRWPITRPPDGRSWSAARRRTRGPAKGARQRQTKPLRTISGQSMQQQQLERRQQRRRQQRRKQQQQLMLRREPPLLLRRQEKKPQQLQLQLPQGKELQGKASAARQVQQV